MISRRFDGVQFNLRAAAIILERGRLLLHRIEGDGFWSVPGGRVEAGELASTAVVREILEEIAEPVVCGDLMLIAENFFTYRGMPHHEIGLYFRVEFAQGSTLRFHVGPFFGSEGRTPIEFRWFDIAELAGLEVRPSFLHRVLPAAEGGLQHIVHHEQGPPEPRPRSL